ncbi:MAG: hypothetical protein NVS2B14_18070 [Chamaesiphon sp.]
MALLLISLFFLTLSSCGGGTETGSSTPTATDPCRGASNIVSCSEQSNLLIEVGSADQMQVHDSQVIKVVLGSLSGSSISDIALKASVPAEKATVTSATTNPVGTPDVPLQFAYGAGYETFATASLSPNPAFTFMPQGDTARAQSLNNSSITWLWSVIANAPGTEILDVNIEAMWKPISTKFPKQEPASIGNVQIKIQVTEPVPTPTPTVSLSPTPIPTTSPSSTTPPPPTDNPFSFPNILTICGLLWTACFGGKAFHETALFEAIKNKTRASLRPPKPLTITNILLGIIIILLVWIILHPTILPHL